LISTVTVISLRHGKLRLDAGTSPPLECLTNRDPEKSQAFSSHPSLRLIPPEALVFQGPKFFLPLVFSGTAICRRCQIRYQPDTCLFITAKPPVHPPRGLGHFRDLEFCRLRTLC
jgi:hypothetical protein